MHNFGDDQTDIGRTSEISAASGQTTSAISAQGEPQRKPSAQFTGANKNRLGESADAAPAVSTVAELDKNNISHLMFAQFLKKDAEVKMDQSNTTGQQTRVSTAGFNDESLSDDDDTRSINSGRRESENI